MSSTFCLTSLDGLYRYPLLASLSIVRSLKLSPTAIVFRFILLNVFIAVSFMSMFLGGVYPFR